MTFKGHIICVYIYIFLVNFFLESFLENRLSLIFNCLNLKYGNNKLNHKYMCLWSVEGKSRGSSFQEEASNTYTLKLG